MFLELLVDRDIDLIFGNVGSDFPPVIEALARSGEKINPFIVPHENVALAMAYGYYMPTGRMQAVALHVGQGTANGLNGIINAGRQSIPMLILAGRTPIIESEVLGGRNNYINWGQEMFDQAGMVREFVKWECELRDSRQLESIIDRAIAMTEPRGPVYLTLPAKSWPTPCWVKPPSAPAPL